MQSQCQTHHNIPMLPVKNVPKERTEKTFKILFSSQLKKGSWCSHNICHNVRHIIIFLCSHYYYPLGMEVVGAVSARHKSLRKLGMSMDGITNWHMWTIWEIHCRQVRENKNSFVYQQHSYTLEMPPNGQPVFTSGLNYMRTPNGHNK